MLAPLLNWISTRLQHTGVTPNALSALGFITTLLVGAAIAAGALRWGGIFLLVASLFDMLDGALARATARSSKFGAFWDSTLDRYSESVTMLALIYYYAGQSEARLQIVLVVASLVGALMTSYTRARAEALAVECRVGLLQRPERILLLVAGLFSGWMLPVLWSLALLTNITALQRIYQVYQYTHQSTTQSQRVERLTDQAPSTRKQTVGD